MKKRTAKFKTIMNMNNKNNLLLNKHYYRYLNYCSYLNIIFTLNVTKLTILLSGLPTQHYCLGFNK